MKYFIPLLLSLALTACITHRHILYPRYNPADTQHYELQYCEHVRLADTFAMKIIDYCPASAGCGVVAVASNCVGLYNKDTIRVISLCNTDTTFHPGQYIKVHTAQRPSFFLSVANCYLYINGKQDSFPFQVRLKTVYGSLWHN